MNMTLKQKKLIRTCIINCGQRSCSFLKEPSPEGNLDLLDSAVAFQRRHRTCSSCEEISVLVLCCSTAREEKGALPSSSGIF